MGDTDHSRPESPAIVPSQMLQSGDVVALDFATWDRFGDDVVIRRLAGNLWEPDFESPLVSELSNLQHAFCAMTVIDAEGKAGARVSIARVADRWWTLMQHGSIVELYGVGVAIDPATPVYEFLEPLWYSMVLLPWNSAFDQAAAFAAAKSVLLGNWVESEMFPQMPEETGLGRLERHSKSPLDPRDFDLASSAFALRNPA